MEDDGWIEGSRAKVGDTIVWSDLRVTVVALQELHDWPPPDWEHERGPWTTMTWGRRDLPLLKELAENPPPGRFLFEPVSREPRERFAEWNGYLRLLEAGLIYGLRKQEGRSTECKSPRRAELPSSRRIESLRRKCSLQHHVAAKP
jgi:hypothetical protein